MSPIIVKYTERRKPLYHFITTVLAIIGGTFTVAGMIDSMVSIDSPACTHHNIQIFSAHQMVKKATEGKLG